jgi:glucose-1-phosphate thymidylyltransferase
MSAVWGIVPAAGRGTRIQPLAFSKELLPVGTRMEGTTERPRAVCEYLIDRLLVAGVNRICFVISPGKNDIMAYFGGRIGPASVCYTVQSQPDGLCDAIFTVLPFIMPSDQVHIGLPDTVWFPQDGFRALPDDEFSFLLFPVEHPELFDAVVTAETGAVKEIQVKQSHADSQWIWGAFKLTGRHLSVLHKLWLERGKRDQYIGTLVNAYLAQGGFALGSQLGKKYVDVGTLRGYHEAVRMLSPEGARLHVVEKYSKTG